MSFEWPEFETPQALDGGRSWTARFDSYDQYREECYYRVTIHDGERAVGELMARVGTEFTGDDWSSSVFVAELRTRIGRVAATRSRPTIRMRELEQLLAQIRNAGMVALNIDLWEHGGRGSASPEHAAAMDAELAEATRQHQAATAALEELVARTRVEAPAELEAWALAHHAYLSMFIDDRANRGESEGIAVGVATREREQWLEVRGGTRAFVDENLAYVRMDAARYRSCFGIDPHTLERVD